MSQFASRFTKNAARQLRADSTDAELRLWSHLRNRQLLGAKFVRQQPIGPYIADFACREHDLIIELDGSQHGTAVATVSDAERTRAVSQHGYRVIRFWNSDVLGNLEGVLTRITEYLEKAPSPGLRYAEPDLSPKGEVFGPNASTDTHPAISGTKP